MIDQRYSMAARCPRCEQRAILTLVAARRLVAASGYRLEAFRCPDEHGWHVRYPAVEGDGGSKPQRPGRR